MKKSFTKLSTFLMAILCSLLFFSCKNEVIGYGVVLWGIPEKHIADNSVVPIYIRSNINHVYVIGTPDNEKIELPLWQVSEPVSKGKAVKYSESLKDFEGHYARVKKDGLPCRAEANNTAKQIYRLRKGEIIKVLGQGAEMTVNDGKKELTGNWIKVLTNNGTIGWSFSPNLGLFTLDSDGNVTSGDITAEETFAGEIPFETLTDRTWRPNVFVGMLKSKIMDTTIINTEYYFSVDTEANKVYLSHPAIQDKELTAISQSWNYNGFTQKASKQYELTDIPLTIYARNENFITIHYTDNSGKPVDLDYTVLEEDELKQAIQREKSKRSTNFGKVCKNGPYVSKAYGKLNVRSDNTFTWKGFGRLAGTLISTKAKTTGTVTTKYGLDKRLATSYDGVLSFVFNGQKDEVLFFYKNEEDGVRLTDASKAVRKDGLIISEGESSLVIFFQQDIALANIEAGAEIYY